MSQNSLVACLLHGQPFILMTFHFNANVILILERVWLFAGGAGTYNLKVSAI